MNNKTKIYILDWLVLIAITCVLVGSCVLVLAGRSYITYLQLHFWIAACMALVVCILMMSWMFKGGAKSALWLWLPPFCLFPKIEWIRWLVVVGMVAGTLTGIILNVYSAIDSSW